MKSHKSLQFLAWPKSIILTATTSLVFLCLLAPQALAYLKPWTLESICREAEHIVVGKVISKKSYLGEWKGVGEVIYTDVTIKVESDYKGDLKAEEELVIQAVGGVLTNGTGMKASGMPTFYTGEKLIVFTHTKNNRQWVAGWTQGKYQIQIKRVVGKAGLPIADDILLPHLKKKILRTLKKIKEEKSSPKGEK